MLPNGTDLQQGLGAIYFISKKMEPRARVALATCRLLRRYHVVGFTRFIPHHTLRFCMEFGEFVQKLFATFKRLESKSDS